MDHASAVKELLRCMFPAAPTLGLDVDGTIDQCPEVFGLLSRIWPGRVIILTLRPDDHKLRDQLSSWGVYYDEIVSVDHLEDKPDAIAEYGIDVFVEDQDECIQGIPDDVLVIKVRNGGNYDFDEHKWIYDSNTGKKL